MIHCRAEDDPAGQVQIGMIDGIAVLTAQIWDVYIGGRCIETNVDHEGVPIRDTAIEAIEMIRSRIARRERGDG